MKIKKIVIFMIILFFILIVKSNASESVTIDTTAISDNFNNSKYVTLLKDSGILVSASQENTNEIVLNYDGVSLTYFLDVSTNIYSASYSIDDPSYNKYNILSALFIDCISTMQGNPVGSQIAFGLDDSFCYSFLKDAGVTKDYLYENNNTVAKYQVIPSIKMPVLSTTLAIDNDIFLLQADTFYPDVDCLVKSGNLIFYKTFLANGDMELYIGDSGELSEYAYTSILNAVSLLLEDSRASYYIKENYSDFSVGNSEFEGVSVSVDVNNLPVSNVDTILLPENMKYAKFTINKDMFKSKLDGVDIPSTPQVGDSTTLKNSKFVVIVSAIGLVVLIVVIIILVKRRKNI